jgi:pimeloyl-ACP methyl ester carboxylesterase
VTTPVSELSIPSSGRNLAALLFTPASRNGAAVLFIHGWRSSKDGYTARVRPLVDRLGITCLTFDLGGHGHSTGDRADLSARDHVDDATAAYDHLVAAAGVDPGRIGVCGASYGAHVAVLLSAVRAVQCLVLRAPALPTHGIGLDQLRAFAGPTLVIESSRDDIVAPATIRAYLAAARRPAHRIIDASHRLVTPQENAAFTSLLLDWFDEL